MASNSPEATLVGFVKLSDSDPTLVGRSTRKPGFFWSASIFMEIAVFSFFYLHRIPVVLHLQVFAHFRELSRIEFDMGLNFVLKTYLPRSKYFQPYNHRSVIKVQ